MNKHSMCPDENGVCQHAEDESCPAIARRDDTKQREELIATVERMFVCKGKWPGFADLVYCHVCGNNVPDYGHMKGCAWEAIKEIVLQSETAPRTSMLEARAAYARDLGKAGVRWPGDAAMEAFAHGWDDGYAARAAAASPPITETAPMTDEERAAGEHAYNPGLWRK